MIHYLSRQKINTDKYNHCIEHSKNTRIYAYSWYLDCVADNWDVLVLDDYEAVMPLPWRSKYFIKYIYPPSWSQQLGVFSIKKIDQTTVELFLESIPKKFRKQTIFLNTSNVTKNLECRDNFNLHLDQSYVETKKGYNKTRRRALKQQFSFLEIRTEKKYSHVIELFKLYTASNLNIYKDQYLKLEKLLIELQNKKLLIIKTAYHKNQLVAGAFFIVSKNRIIYLFSTANTIGKKENAMSLIIDAIIKQYANTDMLLDFEGSNVKGIAFFFKSFGAVLEPYYLFQKPFFRINEVYSLGIFLLKIVFEKF